MRPRKDLLIGTAMTLHQGKGEMLATMLAAHVIEHVGIKDFKKVFSFVLAMRAPNAEYGHFGTHVVAGD
jgi:hypothetical protein